MLGVTPLLLWAFLLTMPPAWGQDGNGADEVDIPDARLRILIEDALSKPRGEAITQEEMATLTRLTGFSHAIESLSGLEFATNLTSLNLGLNRIADISPLADLNKLTELDLEGNAIADPTPLAGLTDLVRLFLQGNVISDVSWLGSLASLAELDLGGNDITDISPLVTLANLEWLNLRSNPLDDQSVEIHIADLRERGIVVLFHDDHGNQLSTATPVVLGTTTAGKIDPHYDVDYFRFEVGEAADVGVFATGDYFRARLLDESGAELEVAGPGYRTAVLIRRRLVPGVYYLELRGSGHDEYLVGAVVDIAVDIPDPNLRTLIEGRLGKTSGETITSGEMAAFFDSLSPADGHIGDLTGLEFAISLKDLWLKENEISDISALSRLTNLQSLGLSDNAVTDISPLADLTGLVRLSLDSNEIADVSPLANLTLLTELALQDNEISNVVPLRNLTKLKWLGLGANNIEDISALTNLTGLEHLDLRNNPLSAESIDVHIPALEAEGVVVLALGDDHGDTPSTATPVVLGEVVTGEIDPYFDEDYFRLEIEAAANVDIFTTGGRNTDGRLLDHNGTGLARDNTEGESANFLIRRHLVPGVYYVVVGAIGIDRKYWLRTVVDAVDVDIPGARLRAVIESALSKSAGKVITSGEIATLTKLEPRFETGFTDLTGLEFATGLTSISLVGGYAGGEIDDLSPLSGLTSLKRVVLSNHNIVDLSPLSELAGLEALTLASNLIVDVSPLSDLVSLTHLWLQDNRITDISALEHLTGLEVLNLAGNRIEDISALTGLTNLRWLNVGNNPLSEESIDVHILALRDRGVTVVGLDDRHGDERETATDLAVGDTLQGEIDPYYDEDYFRLEIGEVMETAIVVSGRALGTLGIVRLLDSEGGEIERSNDDETRDHVLVQRQLDPGAYFVEVSVERQASNAVLPYEYSISALEVVEVDIPDGNLRRSIERVLRKGTAETITSADMVRFTELRAGRSDITDLTGLEFAGRLTRLSLYSNRIEDLSPLSDMTNLRELYLPDNEIADLSPLAGLTGLRELYLGGNRLADLSPLSGLGGLAFLHLGGNEIVDLSPLTNLTKLWGLDLSRNGIRDISPLAGLTNLHRIDLSRNNITDLSPLAGLTKLEELRLEANQVVDISFLENKPDLWLLSLGGNEIVDLTPVTTMPKLRQLLVHNNPLNAESRVLIETLRSRGIAVRFGDDHGNIPETATLVSVGDTVFGQIEPQYDEDYFRLEITRTTQAVISMRMKSWCSVALWDGAGKLIQLAAGDPQLLMTQRLVPGTYYLEVNCEQASGYSITPDEEVNIPDANLQEKIRDALHKSPVLPITTVDMASLEELNAFEAGIADLTGLEFATGLTRLYLERNQISDVSSLAGLTNLTHLNLSNNAIVDISPIADLTNLEWLRLWNNKITDISPLASLTNLTELDLRQNQIVDVAPLGGLTLLSWLYLADNLITDISPIVELSRFELELLDLRRNPLSGDSTRVHLPVLRERGTSIVLNDSHGESLETATVLRLGDLVPGELNPTYDKDYFRLEVVAATDVATFSTGGVNTTGRLLDETGKELVVSRDGGSRKNFLIRRGLDPGIYHVEVSVDIFEQYRHRTGEYGIGALEDVEIDIPDVILRLAIELTLRKARGAVITTADIIRLDALRVSNNRIADLSGLDAAISLAVLIVNDNLITDISPLVDLPNLRFLDLRRNPLNAESLRTHVPALVSRGVDVVLDDNHGDLQETATRLSLGSKVAGTINPYYDKDYFRLDIGHRTEVTLFTTGRTDTYGLLREEVSRWLIADSGNDGVDFNFRIQRVLEPGVYYLEVGRQNVGRQSAGPYVLHADATPVTPPPSVRAETDENVLIVHWGAMPGAGVTGYRVVATPVDGGESLTCEVAAEQTRCVFDGVPKDAVYNVTVQAIGSGGAGPVATTVSEKAEVVRSMWRGWRLDILRQAAESVAPEETAAPAGNQ